MTSNVKGGYKNLLKLGTMFSPRHNLPEVATALPPGVYELTQDMDRNIYFAGLSYKTDKLIVLKDSVSEKVFNQITGFWSEETRAKYKEHGIIHKRGILMHGKPGTGKTCSINMIMDFIVKNEGIVLFNPEPTLLIKGLQQLREIHPNIPVLVVYEEFDAWFKSDKETFLSVLDGELQSDNIVFLATTNHIDKIPDTLKNRPSRFAEVIEAVPPTADTRKQFLLAKLPKLTETEVSLWVNATDGFVIDKLKDLVVSVACLGQDFTETVNKLKKLDYYADANEKEGGKDRVDIDKLQRKADNLLKKYRF